MHSVISLNIHGKTEQFLFQFQTLNSVSGALGPAGAQGIDPNALKSFVGWTMLRSINVKRTNKNNNWNSNRSFFRAAATVQIQCYNRTCFETCFSSIRLMKFHSECHLTSVQLLFLIQLTTKSMFQINVLPSLLVIIFVVRSNAFLSDIVKEVNFTKLKDESNEFEFE